jgi:hypothetical protein
MDDMAISVRMEIMIGPRKIDNVTLERLKAGCRHPARIFDLF